MPGMRKARFKAYHDTEKPLPSNVNEQSNQIAGELSDLVQNIATGPYLMENIRFSDATLPELQVETWNCAAPRCQV